MWLSSKTERCPVTKADSLIRESLPHLQKFKKLDITTESPQSPGYWSACKWSAVYIYMIYIDWNWLSNLTKVVHKQIFPNVCSFETSRFVYISPGLSPIQRSQHFHGTHYHAAFYNITMTIVLSRAPQSAGLIQTLSVEGVRNIQEHKGGGV